MTFVFSLTDRLALFCGTDIMFNIFFSFLSGCLLVLVLVSVHPYVLSVRHWWKVTCDVGYLVKQIILKEFGECCHNFSLNLAIQSVAFLYVLL